MPVDAQSRPVPAIIEYLPYRQRDFTAPRDAAMHPYFAGHGYAAVRVDIRGSGDSDGLPLDEYVQQEQDDALEMLAWIAKQSWCSGETGMIGISWGGFNGLQIAALQPPSLKAVITVCSTDDRYHDDVHYMGGCLLSNNTTWGSTMAVYMTRPPDPAVVGDRWKSMWKQRIESAPVALATWLEHPFRDDYWKHGSVCEDYKSISSAIYAVGGWADGYTNSIPRLLGGLTCPRKGLIGPWAHGYPHLGVPGPNVGFLQEATRWWDRWLKNYDNGIDTEPGLTAWMQQPRKPEGFTEKIHGRWLTTECYPGDVDYLKLFLNADGLDSVAGKSEQIDFASPLLTGIAGGEWCPHGMGPELPTNQRLDDEGSLVFDTQPLQQAMEIFGATVLKLKIKSDKPVATLAARLCMVDDQGESSRITFGVLNLCHRHSHETPTALEAEKVYDVTIKLNDVAQHVPAGYRIRLGISSGLWPLLWPAPEQVKLTLCTGQSSLDLPVRPANSSEFKECAVDPFESAEMPEPKAMTWRRPVSRDRQIATDPDTGQTCITYTKDDGAYYLEDIDMEVDAFGTEQHCITEGDPLSAGQTVNWTIIHSRADWVVRVESSVNLTCDKTHFHVDMICRGFENDQLIVERVEQKKVLRQFL